jgi:hypothetical protein
VTTESDGLVGRVITPETMKELGGSTIEIVSGLLIEESLAIYDYHREWNEQHE